MKAFILSLLFVTAVFSEDLFDLEFSYMYSAQYKEAVGLKVKTREEKNNLAPLILENAKITFEDGEGILDLTITHDKKMFCAQVLGKREGVFYFEKGEGGLEEGTYLVLINGRNYGKLLVTDTLSFFEPFDRNSQ